MRLSSRRPRWQRNHGRPIVSAPEDPGRAASRSRRNGAEGEARQVAPGYQTSPCWLRLGRTMVKVLLFLGGLAILLVSSRQVFLMFRDGSFRARGNRLIVRNAHPIIFWMNFVGLVLFGVVGVALICWQLLT